MTAVALMGRLTGILCAVSLGQQTGCLAGAVGFLESFGFGPGGCVFPLAPRELINRNLQEGWHGARSVHKQGGFVMASVAQKQPWLLPPSPRKSQGMSVSWRWAESWL